MDCEHTIRRVYLYLDGELTTLRRWQITRHLNRCPPCQHGYDFELELRHVVATGCQSQVPPELKARIAEALGLFEAAAGERPGIVEEPPGGGTE